MPKCFEKKITIWPYQNDNFFFKVGGGGEDGNSYFTKQPWEIACKE